jgi:hypothetical protein
MPFKKGQQPSNPQGRPTIYLRTNDGKVCNICNSYKIWNDFPSNGKTKVGLLKYRNNCKQCYNKNWKYRIMSNLTSRTHAKQRANGNGYHIVKTRSKLINLEYLEGLKEKQNGMCYWLKIPIDFTMQDKLRKPSLDRLDNLIGYEIDNVVLTTLFANTGRRDASIIEMGDFIKNFL